ncbi:hypothetical protein BpHYR1_044274 [Brachionus plicatilis]|uniref:Uncharacterized protein n=1 Tax=Brachionus plicatilis TaxID=10195 RepID=A0A3M7PDU6_BRAPC|nr:hypothetical protein BpHYR1_044274 [Brachionus plicatilis]
MERKFMNRYVKGFVCEKNFSSCFVLYYRRFNQKNYFLVPVNISLLSLLIEEKEKLIYEKKAGRPIRQITFPANYFSFISERMRYKNNN